MEYKTYCLLGKAFSFLSLFLSRIKIQGLKPLLAKTSKNEASVQGTYTHCTVDSKFSPVVEIREYSSRVFCKLAIARSRFALGSFLMSPNFACFLSQSCPQIIPVLYQSCTQVVPKFYQLCTNRYYLYNECAWFEGCVK